MADSPEMNVIASFASNTVVSHVVGPLKLSVSHAQLRIRFFTDISSSVAFLKYPTVVLLQYLTNSWTQYQSLLNIAMRFPLSEILCC